MVAVLVAVFVDVAVKVRVFVAVAVNVAVNDGVAVTVLATVTVAPQRIGVSGISVGVDPEGEVNGAHAVVIPVDAVCSNSWLLEAPPLDAPKP